jgi:hypothetical protein
MILICSIPKDFILDHLIHTISVKKKGRVQHIPDSCLYTLLEQRETSEKIKYRAFSQHRDFHQLST